MTEQFTYKMQYASILNTFHSWHVRNVDTVNVDSDIRHLGIASAMYVYKQRHKGYAERCGCQICGDQHWVGDEEG